jgi:hypothetical protein
MSRIETDEDGTIRYYNDQNQTHRDGDLPAVIFKEGTVWYYKHGKRLTKEEFDDHTEVREYRMKKVWKDLLK